MAVTSNEVDLTRQLLAADEYRSHVLREIITMQQLLNDAQTDIRNGHDIGASQMIDRCLKRLHNLMCHD